MARTIDPSALPQLLARREELRSKLKELDAKIVAAERGQRERDEREMLALIRETGMTKAALASLLAAGKSVAETDKSGEAA